MSPTASTTSRSERAARAAALDPIVLAPPPAWLATLTGGPCARAVVWRAGDGVRVRAEGPAGPVRLELAVREGGAAAFRVAPGDPPVRRELPLAPAPADAVARFVRRLRWLGGRDEGYAASDAEREARAWADALIGARSVEELAERGPTDDPEGALEGLSVYLDVVRGRWDRVFDPATSGPGWLAAALEGIRGDVDALLALGRAPRAGDGAFAALAGVAFEQSGLLDAAIEAFRHAFEALAGPERADLALDLARLCRRAGADDAAVGWARRSLLIRDDDDRLIRRACEELVLARAFDDAWRVLRDRCAKEPFDRGLTLALAELLTWAGRADEARPLVERALAEAEDLAALRCLGAVRALEGRWAEAEDAFERAASLAPRDTAVATWLAEVRLRRGDPAEAERRLEAARSVAQNPVHIVLRGALHDPEHVHRDPELRALLEVLGEPFAPWEGGAAQARASAEALLARFGGNRGAPTTVRVEPEAGELGVRALILPESDSTLSSRDAAADTLRGLGVLPLPELDRRFAALAERFPRSPHPLCYWGELDLWRGELDRAIARFDEAHARRPARWAYVGRAAAHLLRGEEAEADAMIAECDRRFDPIAGATTHVYVGEAKRRRGDLDGAIAELETALRAKPTRVAAWINLALAHHARGAPDEAEPIFARLAAWVPRLYWDAWEVLGEAPRWPAPMERMPALSEAALGMMRGNRSSWLVTYFDAGGTFRVARDARAWRAAMGRHAFFVGRGLRARVAAGLRDDGGGA